MKFDFIKIRTNSSEHYEMKTRNRENRRRRLRRSKSEKRLDNGNTESLCYPLFEQQRGETPDWETPVD